MLCKLVSVPLFCDPIIYDDALCPLRWSWSYMLMPLGVATSWHSIVLNFVRRIRLLGILGIIVYLGIRGGGGGGGEGGD